MKFSRGQRRFLTAGLVTLLRLSAFADLPHPVSVADPSAETSLGGNGDSWAPIVSPDGRYVLFASTAENLLLATNNAPMPAPFPARANVFLRDRTNETIILVSVNLSGGAGGNGDSIPTSFSTNGQFVLFESNASDLVANDTNNAADIFVRDLVSGTNILVNANRHAGFANGDSRGSVLTPDGRLVAFVSAASNLVPDDTNGIADVFVRDLQSQTTILASLGAMASSGFSVSEIPEISDDGRYVAFYSTATNLVEGVTTTSEIYLRDLVDETTVLVSTNTRVALSNNSVVSYNPVMSADGKFVAYAASRTTDPFSAFLFRYNLETGFTDLVHTNAIMPYGPRENIRILDITPDGSFIAFIAETNSVPSVCVWDAQTGVSTVASRDSANGIAIGAFESPTLDSTGRFVSFISTATNLTTISIVAGYHVYVRDLLLNHTILADVDADNVALDVPSFAVPAFSANGQFIAFKSFDLQSAAVNPRRSFDVYLRDLQTNGLELISARDPNLTSISPDASSDLSSLSVNGDGRFVAFASLASNLATNDTNANRDVFVRDLLNETNILVSVGTNGFSASGMSFEPAINSDGRFVAFTSMATNLVSGDNNKMRDVFVADLQTRAMMLGSISTNGMVGNSASHSPIISDRGRFLLFRSKASNLTTNAFVSGTENLFLHDFQNLTTTALTTGGITNATMTSDGRFIAFVGRIPNGFSSFLYVWDSLFGTRVYTNTAPGIASIAINKDGSRLVYGAGANLQAVDRVANSTWSIGQANRAPRAGMKFSADGQYFVYASQAVEAGLDTNLVYDVFLYHFQTKSKTLVSRAYNTFYTGDRASDYPDVSEDGRFVVFRSAATNILPNDTNDSADIFVFDRSNASHRFLSANRLGSVGNHRSLAPVFSGDGRTVVFSSWASDLVANDFNHLGDLFSFSFLYATVTAGNSGEGPIISWPSTPGGNYQVQFKDNVDDADWQGLIGTITITGNTSFIRDSSPASDQRLYRVIAF